MTEDCRSLEEVPSSPVDELDSFRNMVRGAFEEARRSKKHGWNEMTAAVLKNRILRLSGGDFSELQFGSPSFIHLVRQVPDMLEIIDTNPPVRLRLGEGFDESAGTDGGGFHRKADGGSASTSSHRRLIGGQLRIRDDLWRAMVDYSSGLRYVFDPETTRARPRQETDGNLPEIPTLTGEKMAEWRNRYIESITNSDNRGKADEQLHHWSDESGRIKDLPQSHRLGWAQFLTKEVLYHLTQWFEEQGIGIPGDLKVSPPVPISRGATVGCGDPARVRNLRDFIIRAVNNMTYDELAAVSLPASVTMRISRKVLRQNG